MCRLLPLLVLLAGPPAGAEALGLLNAIERARAQHERAALAREAVRAAEIEVQAAWAAVLPRMVFRASGRLNDRSIEVGGRTAQDLASAAGELSVETRLFDGRVLPLVDQAEFLEQSVEAGARFALQELAFAVADAWYAARVGTSLRQAAERTVNTAQENLEVVRARREVGRALSVDEAQAQLRVVQAQEGLARAQNLEASTLDLLGLLVGLSGPIELAEPPAAVEAEAGEERADSRLDVRALMLASRAAQVLVDGAWMDFLPALGLRGSAAVGTQEAADGEIYGGALLLTLEWVLYDAGRSARQDREASRARSASLEVDLRTREARFAVRQARRDLTTVHATGVTVEQALVLARETRVQVLARYRAGRATALELVAAEDTLRQAELAQATHVLEVYRARLSLFRALGLDPLGQESAE